MPHYLLTESELRSRSFSGVLAASAKIKRFRQSVKNMYEDDPWDRGRGYIGPLPLEEDSEQANIMATLKRQFTHRNAIKEVVDRLVDALLSRSPDWKIYNKRELIAKSVEEELRRNSLQTSIDSANKSADEMVLPKVIKSDSSDEPPILPPRVEELPAQEKDPQLSKKLIEAEVILSELWTSAQISKVLKKALVEYLLTGEGKIRDYVSRHYIRLTDSELSPDERLLEAIKYIYAEFVENDRAKVIDDDGDKLSVVKLKKKLNGQAVNGFEVSFVDEEDGQTYLATFNETALANLKAQNKTRGKKRLTTSVQAVEIENSEDIPVSETVQRIKQSGAEINDGGWNLNGEILVHELKGDPFVTNSMLQQNRALNLDLTLAISVLVESGFSEMVTTNVALDVDETTGLPMPLQRGPSSVNNLIGEQTATAEGEVKYTDPRVYFKDPTPIDVFIKGERLFYSQILHEAKQEFVLMAGDSTTTGESRIQARQDFVKKAQQYKPDLDKIGSELLTSLLHLTASVADLDGYFDGIAVKFDSRISAGELSAAEQQVIVARYEKGLISRETALVLLGTEEPLIEIDLIRLDEAEQQRVQIRRLAAVSMYAAGNTSSATGGLKDVPRDGNNKKSK